MAVSVRTWPVTALAVATLLLASAAAAPAWAEELPHLAPGFSTRAPGSRLLLVPADLELFSISAGGVPQPRADWTSAARRHVQDGLAQRKAQLGAEVAELSEAQLDDFAELHALHSALAQAIVMHHGHWQKLPTKGGRLDWSLGDAVASLRDRTGADYVLFTRIRDTYASGERKAAMLAMAALGVGLVGGSQIGYASLVDLRSGRVVWFNDLNRLSGDLREAEVARETLDALLKNFPQVGR